MKSVEKSDRLVFPKCIVYNPKVKTGNWYEDRKGYKRECHNHNTEYYHEFHEKPITTIPRSVKWDILWKNEGEYNIAPPRVSDSSPNFYDNFATTYELAYTHFPKIAPPIVENSLPTIRTFGKYRPVLEFIESYGNINNYGMGDKVKKAIEQENDKRRSTSLSLVEDEYTEPEKECYVFCRWPRFRAIKKKTRDIYPTLPPNHPKLSSYNPITWECKDLEKTYNYELDCAYN